MWSFGLFLILLVSLPVFEVNNAVIKSKILDGVYQLRENDKKICKAKYWRTIRIILDEKGQILEHVYCCSVPNCFLVISTNLCKDGTGKLSRHYKNCDASQRIGIESFFNKEFRPPAAKKIKVEHKTKVNEAALSFVVCDLRPTDSVTKPGMVSLLSTFTEIGACYGSMTSDDITNILPSRFSVRHFLLSLMKSISNQQFLLCNCNLGRNFFLFLYTDLMLFFYFQLDCKAYNVSC